MSPQAAPPPRDIRFIAAEIALLLVLLVLPATPAAAQTAGQRAILSLTVNQAPQGEVLVIVRPGDVLIEPATLDRAALKNYAGRRETVGGREFVSLTSLAPGIAFVFDEAALTLTITAGQQHLGSVVLNIASPRPEYRFARATSAFVNYGANWTKASGADGAIEAGVSMGPAVVQNTVSWDERQGFIRGLSSVVVDEPDRLRRWTLGDSSLPTQGLGSGMLIGGVRVARDYGLDPYFIQFPTLGLSGATLTPSTVDVYVNGNLVSRQTVAAGSFTLQNLPMPTGNNNTRVVVRDAFGREQQMTAPFYLTTSRLARGLHEYDYAVGFPRSGSADANWSYGRLSAVARHRYGFNDNVTAGFMAEADRRGIAAGPTASLRLRRSDVELSASVSHMDGRSGAAALVGIGHFGRRFNFNARLRSMSPAYSTLTTGERDERVKVEASGLVGVVVGSRLSLSLQEAVSETYKKDIRSQSSLIGNVQVARLVSLFVNVSRTSEAGVARTSLYAGMGFALGTVTNASVWTQAGAAGSGGSAEVQRSLPIGNGIGYRARAALGGTTQAEGTLEAQGPYGRYQVGQAVVDGQSSAHAGVTGGLAVIGGGVHATRTINESFALVRVPDVGGIRTYLNNHEVGRTNRGGDALVPNLLPYYANRIAISDQDVPFDHEIETVEQAIAPPYRGGALVTFQASPHRSVTGTVAMTVGTQTVVPALGELTITVGTRTYSSPVGAGGEFYFEKLPAGDYTAVLVFKGDAFRLALSVPSSSAPVIRLGIVRCGGSVTGTEDRQP